MNAPRLSVIIPVYNVEAYLAQCVESVLAQSLKDLEIILVDDGSTDSCPDMCDAYARQDARVRVIHQANVGLAGARNSGLLVAKGDYVAFLDSDDWLERDAYEKLHAKAHALDADIVFCQAKYFDDSQQKIIEADDNSSLPLFCDARFSKTFSWSDIGIDKVFSYDSFVVAWNKICRREFLTALHADFPVGLIYEDNPFYFQTIFAAKKLAVVRERLICYRTNRKGSIIDGIAEGRNTKAIHVLAIMASIEMRMQNLLPAKEYQRYFYAYAYSESRYKFALVPEELQPKYLALAKALLPLSLYLKLRLHVFLRRLKAQRFSYRFFIRYMKAPGRRKIELLCNIPLISIEKTDTYPGQFDAIVAFGESPLIENALTERFSGNGYALYTQLNSCDLSKQLHMLFTRPATGIYTVNRNGTNNSQGASLQGRNVESPIQMYLESIRSLFAISGSILIFDFAKKSLCQKQLKVLFYQLSCIFYDKQVQYIRLGSEKGHTLLRSPKGLHIEKLINDADAPKCIRRILQGMELKRFYRFFIISILGFPVLTGRRR